MLLNRVTYLCSQTRDRRNGDAGTTYGISSLDQVDL